MITLDTKELARLHRAIADLWDPVTNPTVPPQPSPPLSGANFYGAKNETIGFRFSSSNPINFNLPNADWQLDAFSIGKVHTTNPSFTGAQVGPHEDPLYETFTPGEQWIDLTIPKTANSGINTFDLNGQLFSIYVFDFELPDKPSMPLLIELVSWYCYQGHYANTAKWDRQLPITQVYHDSLKRHRIEPMRPWLTAGDTQQWIDKAYEYWVLPVRSVDANTLTDSYLANMELEARYCLGKGLKPIIYLTDEPNAAQLSVGPTLYNNVKSKVPSAEIMVTTIKQPNKMADIYCPVFQHIGGDYIPSNQYQKLWGYISCMSHGCNYLGDSGEPDIGSVERPGIYSRAFFWAGEALGCEALLYFNSVEFFKYTSRDPFAESLWDFSGNGDGTLFYPDRINERPIESLRLKHLRRGSYDMDYLWLAEQKGIAINHMARDWKDWDKDNQNYDDEIIRLGLEIEK